MVNEVTLLGLIEYVADDGIGIIIPKTKTTDEFKTKLNFEENTKNSIATNAVPGSLFKIQGSLCADEKGTLGLKIKKCELININMTNNMQNNNFKNKDMEVRKCGINWAYCDGDCKGCNKKETYPSDKIDNKNRER